MKSIGMTIKKFKPTLSVEDTDLPAMKTWEVGKTYTVTAQIKMVYQSEGNEYDYGNPDEQNTKKMRARFKILKITPEKGMPVKKKKPKVEMYPRVKS
jgi:hypothetical protein